MARLGEKKQIHRVGWIQHELPELAAAGCAVTSPPDRRYNCIAWAAGTTAEWWEDTPGYRWPVSNRSPRIESLEEVFCSLGYKRCESEEREEGFEKVALYADGDVWTHASRQMPNGGWKSKLGMEEDVVHPTARSASGKSYGTVYCIMRRPKS